MVIKSATLWVTAKASAGHFPPVDRHQSSRRREEVGYNERDGWEKSGGRRKRLNSMRVKDERHGGKQHRRRKQWVRAGSKRQQEGGKKKT